jgi:hypothetical protein
VHAKKTRQKFVGSTFGRVGGRYQRAERCRLVYGKYKLVGLAIQSPIWRTMASWLATEEHPGWCKPGTCGRGAAQFVTLKTAALLAISPTKRRRLDLMTALRQRRGAQETGLLCTKTAIPRTVIQRMQASWARWGAVGEGTSGHRGSAFDGALCMVATRRRAKANSQVWRGVNI